MMEERGRVVRIEEDAVWVETRRQNACGSCQAKSACGHGVMSRLLASHARNQVRVSCDFSLTPGDEVTIALPEQTLLSASVLVYLLPLVIMLLGAVLGTAFGWPEPLVIMLSLVGMAGSFSGIRWWTRRMVKGHYEPVVLYRHIPCTREDSAVEDPVLEQTKVSECSSVACDHAEQPAYSF